MLYGVVAGIVAGYLRGGGMGRLADLPIHWAWLALVAFGAQVVLFFPGVGTTLGGLAPVAYVLSSVAVLAVVLRNLRLPGVPLIAAGAACNVLAIVANGGYMPASPDALASLGWTEAQGYSNSVVLADPALAPLSDIFALPGWLPFANVFSVGDVLIAVGIAIVIAWGMGRRSAPGA
ncbi:MAG: DUF5317 domain-containing protein [Chloroflexota bacterium]